MKRVQKNSNEVVNTVNNVSNAISDKLKNTDYSKSNAILKAIKNIAFLFAAIRTNILAQIANESTLSLFKNDARIKLLRQSKKDSTLYRVLRDLAAFNYKMIVTKDSNKVVSYNFVKAFTLKSVLNSCDLYLSFSSVELTSQLIEAIRNEHVLKAVKTAKENVSKAQNKCNDLMLLIEDLTDKKLIEDMNKELLLTEKQLSNKVKLYDYVKVASNRIQIK